MTSVLANILEDYLTTTPAIERFPISETTTDTEYNNETDTRIDQRIIIELIQEVRESNRLSCEVHQLFLHILQGINHQISLSNNHCRNPLTRKPNHFKRSLNVTTPSSWASKSRSSKEWTMLMVSEEEEKGEFSTCF